MKRVWLEFLTMISVETYTFHGRSTWHGLATSAAVCPMSFTLCISSIYFLMACNINQFSTRNGKLNNPVMLLDFSLAAHITMLQLGLKIKWVFHRDSTQKLCYPAGTKNQVSTTLFYTRAVISKPEGSLDFFTLGDSCCRILWLCSFSITSVLWTLVLLKSVFKKSKDPAVPTKTQVWKRTPCSQEMKTLLLS